MAQLNQFENIPVFGGGTFIANNFTNFLYLNAFVLNESISFNVPSVLLSVSAAVTLTISLGLYSLNGSTLSLANSASANPGFGGAGISYITMVTSATQNLTPGNWWWGGLFLSGAFVMGQYNARSATAGGYGGIFIDGIMSASTNALPASIATSNCNKFGGSVSIPTNALFYVLLSA